ncbi:MAG: hypothetical protein CMN86_00085 [Stappia sp.]|nr:hypothetical protein [Stappia sp.]
MSIIPLHERSLSSEEIPEFFENRATKLKGRHFRSKDRHHFRYSKILTIMHNVGSGYGFRRRVHEIRWIQGIYVMPRCPYST